MDFLLILLLGLCTIAFCFSSASHPWLARRLPRNLDPYHYNLAMKPHFYNGYDFEGNVSIQMKVQTETRFIILHAVKLNISQTRVFVNRTILRECEHFLYEPNSYLVLNTRQALLVGSEIQLDLNFRGQLNNLIGVYKDGYVNETTGRFKPILATKFKPNFARLVFPNFDEPYFKSRFTITLRHWANYTAVSNMEELGSWMAHDDWKLTMFKTTPRMNSFLVSFIISNLHYRNNTLPGGLTHRLWGRRDRLAEADWALNMTPIIQRYLNNEVYLPHPVRKLDQFVMPNGNRTANWGLITYHEHQILFDPIRDGEEQRQDNLANLAIQLAYNYVANFVTCQNWDHVWLNHGLATFYAFKSLRAADPTMIAEEKFMERIMAQDATPESRPLVTSTRNIADTSGFYHPLPYYKGAAILKMIESFLGVIPLRRGLMKFIRNFAFRTAGTNHLWATLQQEIDTSNDMSLNISEIMNTWVHTAGFPVIDIRLLPDNKLNATQKRFLTSTVVDSHTVLSEYGYKWYVPLTYQTKGGKSGLVWLNETDAVFENLLSQDDEWITFNHDQSGYYLVNYDTVLWNRIKTQLLNNHTVFTEKQRSKLLSDALTLAKNWELSDEVLTDLITYADHERSRQPWLYISPGLEYIYSTLINNNESVEYFESYVLNLTANLMDELQVVDKGSSNEKLMRPKIMSLSCTFGHRGCIENATRLFKSWIQNETNIVPANFRREVYCAGMKNSVLESSSEWNTTFERYIVAETEKDRHELLSALACISDRTLLERLLGNFISNPLREFSYNDFKKAAAEFALNAAIYKYSFQWLKLHYQEIMNRYSRNRLIFILQASISPFFSYEDYTELMEFLRRVVAENPQKRNKRFEERAELTLEFMSDLRRWITNSTIRKMVRSSETEVRLAQQNA